MTVSTPSTIISQDTSQLDLSQSGLVDSTPGLNQEAKNPIFSTPESAVSWKTTDDLQPQQTTLWLKSENDSQDTTHYFTRSEDLQESQCLRDLLTQQPEKLQNLDLNVLSDVPSQATVGLQNGHHDQSADLSFNGTAMMGTSCASTAEVFSSTPGDPVMMNVTTYNSPEMIQSPPQMISGKGQPAGKTEASGTQGSIDQMSTMMTMLRDSELLQLINPSTFDNV